MSLQGTYDPSKNLISVAGIPIVGPFGESDLVTCTRNEEGFLLKVGCDGNAARSRNANRSGKIQITIQQSSPTNLKLMILAELDESSATGIGPFLCKDGSDQGTRAEAQNCWITKIPDLKRGKEIGDVTWELETDTLLIHHAGL